MRWKRIFQFNLRTFLLFSIAVALLCSAYVCLPFSTFELTQKDSYKQLKIKTLYPICSVCLDVDAYSLENTERIPEWQRKWLETDGHNSWNEIVLHYQDTEKPKWIMFDTPHFGYQYYEINEVDGTLKFCSRRLPEFWANVFRRNQ